MYFMTGGPPSSPPTALLLRISRMMIAIIASEQKIVTEKAKLERKEWLSNVHDLHLTPLLTFPMAPRICFHSRRDKQRPWSMQCRCPKTHSRRYFPSHYQHSHPHTCPEWLQLYWRTYLNLYNRNLCKFMAVEHWMFVLTWYTRSQSNKYDSCNRILNS